MAVNLPASIANGDLLIAAASVRNAGTWTLPSDWQEFTGQSSGGVGELTVFWKIATGSEGSTATWTASTGTTAVWHVRKITGWHGTTSPEIATTSSGGVPGTTSNSPALNPTNWDAEDTLWISVGGAAAESVSLTSAPSDYSGEAWTNVSAGGASCSVGTAVRQANAASEDPGAWNTSASRWWYAATVAIRPAAAVVEEITGDAGGSLPGITAAATGTQVQTGTASATLQPPTADASGNQTNSGTASVTLESLTAAATGTNLQTGAGSSTLQRFTANATGVMVPEGTASASLNSPTAAATGTHTQTGAASGELRRVAVTMAGSIPNTGAAAVTLAQFLVLGDGYQLVEPVEGYDISYGELARLPRTQPSRHLGPHGSRRHKQRI